MTLEIDLAQAWTWLVGNVWCRRGCTLARGANRHRNAGYGDVVKRSNDPVSSPYESINVGDLVTLYGGVRLVSGGAQE